MNSTTTLNAAVRLSPTIKVWMIPLTVIARASVIAPSSSTELLVTSSSRWSEAVGLTNCLYMSRENRVAELSSKLQAVETSAAHRAASVMPDNTGFNDMMTSGKAEAAATLGKLALAITPIRAQTKPIGSIIRPPMMNPRCAVSTFLAPSEI